VLPEGNNNDSLLPAVKEVIDSVIVVFTIEASQGEGVSGGEQTILGYCVKLTARLRETHGFEDEMVLTIQSDLC